MTDIVNIKKAFRTLNSLKVKEVILPYDEYLKLKDAIYAHSDDGGSHHYQERFDEFSRTWIYGIEVSYEV